MTLIMLYIGDFIKWPIAIFLGLIVLYAAVRIGASAWFRSKQDYISTQRKAFNSILKKSNVSSIKERKGEK